GDCAQDRAAAETARAAGVPVNVADQPDLSDFIMPAIVRRGDVAIGISTGGASPALARLVRERIERVLPARLGELARFAGKLRDRVKALFPQPEARRDLLKLLNTVAEPRAEAGVVHIVGAGPGDPDLLTLRALQLLQRADI